MGSPSRDVKFNANVLLSNIKLFLFCAVSSCKFLCSLSSFILAPVINYDMTRHIHWYGSLRGSQMNRAWFCYVVSLCRSFSWRWKDWSSAVKSWRTKNSIFDARSRSSTRSWRYFHNAVVCCTMIRKNNLDSSTYVHRSRFSHLRNVTPLSSSKSTYNVICNEMASSFRRRI